MRIFVFLTLLSSFVLAEFQVKSVQELRNAHFVRQNYEESCGAASLANIINLFSLRQFNEEAILQFLEQKTDILSFAELKRVALKMGFESEGFTLKRGHFDEIQTPLLVQGRK